MVLAVLLCVAWYLRGRVLYYPLNLCFTTRLISACVWYRLCCTIAAPRPAKLATRMSSRSRDLIAFLMPMTSALLRAMSWPGQSGWRVQWHGQDRVVGACNGMVWYGMARIEWLARAIAWPGASVDICRVSNSSLTTDTTLIYLTPYTA